MVHGVKGTFVHGYVLDRLVRDLEQSVLQIQVLLAPSIEELAALVERVVVVKVQVGLAQFLVSVAITPIFGVGGFDLEQIHALADIDERLVLLEISNGA